MDRLSERAARMLQALGAVMFAIPLWSLTSLASTPWIIVALVVLLGAMAALRPAAALMGLVFVLPLAFGLAALTDPRMAVAQVAESFVLAFLAGSAVRSAVDARLLAESRLAKPAMALALVVIASGLSVAFAQFEGVAATGRAVWQTARGYFAGAGAIDLLQPSFRWMEMAALSAFVEAAVRQRPTWRETMLVVWLASSAAVAGQTAQRLTEVAISRGEGLRGAIDLLVATRLSPVYPDLNAAGSLFAMFVVIAVVFGVTSRRRLAMIAVAPFHILALVGTQSRAAVGAAICTLGYLSTRGLLRSRRRVGAVLLAAGIIASVSMLLLSRPTHAGVDAAVNSRVELAKIALKITREAPVFGVGLGRFQRESRDYLEPGFVALFPEAAAGENAHNNFLQILAELGGVGLLVFLWLLWRAFVVGRAEGEPASPPRGAIVAGLATFLLSALVGHPLLIFEVAVAVFLGIGLAAAMTPAPEPRPSKRQPASLLLWAVAGVVVVSLPWRLSAALAPQVPEVTGAGPLQTELDGVPYRFADATSVWRVRAHSRTAAVPLRWDATGARDCAVQIYVKSKLVDEVTLSADTWVPVRFAIPPGGRPSEPPQIELRVSSPACRLLVGPIAASR